MPRARGRLSGEALAEFNRLHPRGPGGRFGSGGARARLADKPPKTPAAPVDPRTAARNTARERLSQVGTRKEGRAALQGLPMADLRKLAAKNNVRPGRTRAGAIDAIVNATVGKPEAGQADTGRHSRARAAEAITAATLGGRHRAPERGPAASRLHPDGTPMDDRLPTPRAPRGVGRRSTSPRRATTHAARAQRQGLPVATWFNATGQPQGPNGQRIEGPYRQTPEFIDRLADELDLMTSTGSGLVAVRQAARRKLDVAMLALDHRPDLTNRRGAANLTIDAGEPDQIVALFRRLANDADRPPPPTPRVSVPADSFIRPPGPPQLPDLPENDRQIGRLVPTSQDDRAGRTDQITNAFKAKLDGQYAGLTVRVDEVTPYTDQTSITATILDANGVQVGTTTRSFRRNGSKLWVYHAYLELSPRVQGQGFAEAWNGHLMDWYIESGLDRVEVTANIDVGGYTWARQGFDFKNRDAADEIKGRLEREMSRNADRYTAEQVIAANDVLARMSLPFDDDSFPTAYEVSQVGRLPGQGKTDPWPGKQAMLGSHWSGVKPVPRRGATQVPSKDDTATPGQTASTGSAAQRLRGSQTARDRLRSR